MNTLRGILAGIASLGLMAFAPCSASAAVYELKFYQVDDTMTASITNSVFTDQLVLSEPFGPDYGYVDISSYVAAGLNTITLQLTNDSPGQGWTYGYDFRIDGVSAASGSCGSFNSFGCDGDDKTQGVVFTKDITFSAPSDAPEPASWAMMVGGFGLIGMMARRQKHMLIMKSVDAFKDPSVERHST